MGIISGDKLCEYGKEIYERLRLKTFPFAVKLIEKDKNIPQDAVRPQKDLGCHLASCQAFALSRREGMKILQTKEDMWCSEAAIGFGFGGLPQYFLEGNTRFPQEVETLGIGKIWAQNFPHLESERYMGILSSPLELMDDEPDVVVFYCDSVQLKMFTGAVIWKYGQGIQCRLVNMGACVFSVVPVMQTGKFNIAIPCGGDRAYAICQDDEIIFSAAPAELETIVLALRHLDGYKNKVPIPFAMRPDYPTRESYIKLGKILGLDMEKATVLKKGKYV